MRFLMLNWRDPGNPLAGGAERVTLGYLAALVRRDAIDAFESAVHRAAESFDDRYVFDLGGPHPPHSFVSVQLSLDAA